MNIEEILKYFLKENEIEITQKLSGQNINDQNLHFDKESIPKMPKDNFFKSGNIFINKHNRYSEMPQHTHEFVEFNYMLSGKSVHYVNNEKIELNTGDLLLMDRDVVQKIETLNTNDILINILIKGESISTDLVVDMAKASGLVNHFFINASSLFGNHNRYIHFELETDTSITLLLEKILIEYFNQKSNYSRALNLYMSLLIIELSRFIENTSNLSFEELEYDSDIVEILAYIEANIATVTLSNLSEYFGYNQNYLSNKLKTETGMPYQQLLNKAKYNLLIKYLQNTNKTLEEISSKIGYKNIPSIYKLLSKYTNMTPNEIRQKKKE